MTAEGRSSKWTRPIGSFDRLEEFGRVRLSDNFFMRDFLHSEIANFYGLRNIPDDPALAIEVGERLCQELLEPINATFGRIAIRSAYRSCEVNALGNAKGVKRRPKLTPYRRPILTPLASVPGLAARRVAVS